MEECSLCGPVDIEYRRKRGLSGSIRDVECQTCGKYRITNCLFENIASSLKYKDKRHILSGITREASEYENIITIKEDNIQEILDSTSIPDGPFEKIDRIIKYVHRKSTSAASSVEISLENDYPIAYAKDSGEYSFYLDKAVELSYLEGWRNKCRLTLKGWERLNEIRKKQVESNQAFVAMWFGKEMDISWVDGFKPALEKTGYNPIRVDLVEHNEKICDRIIAEIRKSGLLVADFTGNRGGVYFEAGFAKGLGIPVIWTCRKDHLDNVHFDTRQFNHIEWESPQELKKKLIDRIEATLPNRVRKQGKEYF